MNSDQAQQLLTLAQSQYDASVDATATAHNALAYTQYMATVVEVGVLVLLVIGIVLLCLLRPTEGLS